MKEKNRVNEALKYYEQATKELISDLRPWVLASITRKT